MVLSVCGGDRPLTDDPHKHVFEDILTEKEPCYDVGQSGHPSDCTDYLITQCEPVIDGHQVKESYQRIAQCT